MFYVLKDVQRGNVRGDTEASEEAPWRQGEATACAACGGYVTLLPWLPPHRASLECWDREFGDLAFGVGKDLLVSERFKRLYQEAGLTGLSGFEPVKIVKVKRHRRFQGDPPAYFHVRVGRTEAAIDLERSGFVWGEPDKVCPVCRGGGDLWRWKRIVIEEGTWTGEDIFIPRGLSVFVASERFRRFCEWEQITNAVLVPADEYWCDFRPERNYEKAQEILAAPLGPTLLEKVKPDGEVWRYDAVGNYVVVAGPDGKVRRILRPMDGIEFWQRH